MGILGIFIWIGSSLFIFFIIRKFFNGPMSKLAHSMSGKTIIVTGSNTGIGRETALELIDRGATVIFACRDETKTNVVINSIKDNLKRENATFLKLDLSSFSSIENFVENFKSTFRKFDILINNAGAFFTEYSEKEGTIENTLMTNHIGVVYLTSLLLSSFNEEGRIINVSSEAHKFITQKTFDEMVNEYKMPTINTPKKYSFFNAYVFSKLGNVFHAQHLDNFIKIHDMKIKAVSLNPGAVKSDVVRSENIYVRIFNWTLFPIIQFFFYKNTNVGAQTSLNCAYIDYNQLISGAYYSNCKIDKIGKVAEDPINLNKMMDLTKEVIINRGNNVPSDVEAYLNIN